MVILLMFFIAGSVFCCEDVCGSHQEVARTLLQKDSNSCYFINDQTLGEVIQQTVQNRPFDENLMERLPLLQEEKLNDTSRLLLHVTDELARQAVDQRQAFQRQLSRQLEQKDLQLQKKERMHRLIFLASSCVCVALGWVLHTGC